MRQGRIDSEIGSYSRHFEQRYNLGKAMTTPQWTPYVLLAVFLGFLLFILLRRA